MAKVLIVEDDMMTADMVEEALVAAGHTVCGIARTVNEALVLGRDHKPDLAVIDMRLADGGFGTEVAGLLDPDRKLGILYATGNVSRIMLTAANGHACLAKPFRPEDLVRSLEIVANFMATGAMPSSRPPGFDMLPPHPYDQKSSYA